MKFRFLLCTGLLFLTAGLPINTKSQAVNVKDSLALVDLYNSASGPAWRNNNGWLHGPVKTWVGVTVTGTRVTDIDLTDNNLNGVLHSSFGDLKALKELSLYNNLLHDSIPAAIGNLINLTYITLDKNQFSYSIPSSITNLAKLKYLSLSQNQLSGSIPSVIGNLINLQYLGMDYNQLSGSIPVTIGKLTNLTYLNLGRNYLSGRIPAAIGDLTNLTYLELWDNQLSGSIPSAIGKLVNLYGLYLFNNQLSGTIPDAIGNLTNLQYLLAYNNALSGAIPFSIDKLKHLTILQLFSNQLTQSTNVNFPSFNSQSFFTDISDNRFTFNGLEFAAKKFTSISYAPQALIPVHQHGSTLSVSAGGTLANNTYKWFAKGRSGSTTIKGDSVFHPAQSGQYYAMVNNAIATQLTLHTDTITYTVQETNNENISFITKAVKPDKDAHFSVYPNPAKDVIHVAVNGTANIILANASGTVVLEKGINRKDAINIGNYSNGIYYLLNRTTGEVRKIIVMH